MAKRLSDRKKKLIIADYAELGSYAATSRKHGVAVDTVRRVVLTDPESLETVNRKKDANTQDVLSYMDGKVAAFKLLGDYVFDKRLNPGVNEEELAKLPLDKLMAVFGIATDKMLKSKEIRAKCEHEDAIEPIKIILTRGRKKDV